MPLVEGWEPSARFGRAREDGPPSAPFPAVAVARNDGRSVHRPSFAFHAVKVRLGARLENHAARKGFGSLRLRRSPSRSAGGPLRQAERMIPDPSG